MKTLYVHIPFCKNKCFYCSFVVSVGQLKKTKDYLNGLEREAQLYKGERVQSVYIGGGTPAIMEGDDLKKLFSIIRKSFHVDTAAEWTIEANPESLSEEKIKLIKAEGVNRISLGIQSLNDRYLKYLGRNHDSQMAIEAYHKLRKEGFNNINVDLMFAFPGQTMDELEKDVQDVLKFECDHLSLYTLTVEKYSRFYARKIKLEDGQYQARQYQKVCDLLDCSGFKQYEVSNFAQASKVSRHNLNYWQGGEYIGLGLGAHSYINGERFWNTAKLNNYISLMQNKNSAKEGCEVLSAYEQMRDVVLFGLRMNQGVPVKETTERFGCFLNENQKKQITYFVEHGFLIMEDGYLKASPKGRLLLDELCSKLV